MHLLKKVAKIYALPTAALFISGIGLACYFDMSKEEPASKMAEKLDFERQAIGKSAGKSAGFFSSLLPSPSKKAKLSGAKFVSKTTFSDFLDILASDAEDANLKVFTDILKKEAECLESFYFECPPVNQETVKTQPFEFVLLPSKTLHTRKANPSAFQEHFTEANTVAFKSLGKDAELIAPCPKSKDLEIYGHAAIFMKKASDEQVQDLWKTVGETMKKRLQNQKGNVWLSTAGDGISWLHVRLDSRPKYYNYQDYTEPLNSTL